MSGEPIAPDDYRWARQVAALLLIGVIVVIVLLDAVVDDYDARASVLVPLLLTVDWLLSRCRAMTNVTSDILVAVLLDRFDRGESTPEQGADFESASHAPSAVESGGLFSSPVS